MILSSFIFRKLATLRWSTVLQERGVPPLPELDITDRPFKTTVRKIRALFISEKLWNIQLWSQISETSPYFLACYCFRGELFDLQRGLLFSSSLLHLRCISGPRSTAIGPARSDCPSAIGWNGLHMKCDWSMVGKAERRCVVIFFFSFFSFFSLQCSAHVGSKQTGRGYHISSAVCKAERNRDIFNLQLHQIYLWNLLSQQGRFWLLCTLRKSP